METVEVVKRLRRVGKKCGNELPYLNSGGCGIYAIKIANKLKSLGLNARCRVLDYEIPDGVTIENARALNPRNGQEWERALGERLSHVLVEFDDGRNVWTHDSNYTVKGSVDEWNIGISHLLAVEGCLTVEETQLLVDDASFWNDAFDRRTGIPVIDKNIQEGLA
jgi:hypothetical protein